MQITEQPKHKHDCDRCEFLGRYEYEGQTYDLYTCEQLIGGRTVIARYGDDGPEYTSGMTIAKALAAEAEAKPWQPVHPLAIAFQRYQDRYGIHGA